MNHQIVSRKAFVMGFFIGTFLSFLPAAANLLRAIQEGVYPVYLRPPIFNLTWGVIIGATLAMANSILEKEGALGLVKIVALMGVFVMVFWLILTNSLI